MWQRWRRVILVITAVAATAVVVVRAAPSVRGGVLPLHRPPPVVHAQPNAMAVRTIVEENRLPGSDAWSVTKPALDGQIAAFTAKVSAQHGDTVGVYVSTKGGASFRADVYRMGWYGGKGARLVESIRDLRGDDQGRWDPASGLIGCRTCTLDPATLLLDTHWRESFRIGVGGDWVSGYYLIKLQESATGTQTYAIFVVRDDGSHAPALVQASTNTWQAYNTWGDASLYGSFGADRRYIGKRRRAYRVSYDRPYDMRITNSTNDGAGQFFSWEYDFVRWAESRGYDISYTTNADVTLRPRTLLQHRLFVSLGHDEYWTAQERDAVTAARDAGVNLAFFGGNEAYWQARLESASSGTGRVLTAYKDAALDSMARGQPALATVQFADAPLNRPTSLLTGLAYGSNATPDQQAWHPRVTYDWVFANTGMRPGDVFPGIVGYEYDRAPPPALRPPLFSLVATSPVDGFNGRDTATSSLYIAASGAIVFNAGTVSWSWGLDNAGHERRGKFADPRLQKLTANIMDRLAAPPVR